jgi:hypothetical protein
MLTFYTILFLFYALCPDLINSYISNSLCDLQRKRARLPRERRIYKRRPGGEKTVSADIPVKIGPDFLVRTIVPGLTASAVFLETLICPFIQETWNPLSLGDKIIAWILSGFFVGLLFLLCDSQIYQILEGFKFWPCILWRWKYKRIQKSFQDLDKELEYLINYKKERSAELNSTDLEELSSKISRISARIREFPPAYEIDNFSGRYPTSPTRLGNVIDEYECYSLNRYGIHMMVFWNHLSQLLSGETRGELDLRGAFADLCVYLCLASLVYIIIGPTALFLRQQSWIVSWSHLAPVGSLLHLMFAILVFKFFYELSISQHKNYGRFVKAIFDLHRETLARSLGIKVKKGPPVSRQQSEKEKALWKRYQDYYLDYKFIE